MMLRFHELGNTYTDFADDGSHRTFANLLAAVMRHRNDSTIRIPHPQFMGPFSMPIKAKPHSTQPMDNFLIVQFP